MKDFIKAMAEEIIDIQTEFKGEKITIKNSITTFDAATQTETITETVSVTIPALFKRGDRELDNLDGIRNASSYFLVKKSDISFTIKDTHHIIFNSTNYKVKRIATDTIECLLRLYVYDI